MHKALGATCLLASVGFAPFAASAQEPASWTRDLTFHTFSIAAVDPATGEVGVAVTTRVACVGNGVPWVRAGVGAVATQASTRVEYGVELLDMIAGGMTAQAALRDATSKDTRASRRQVGVIGLRGGSAQHTGDSTSSWAGHRAGLNFVTQGNLLVGPEVLDEVARSFESTEGSGRHLADRMIEALAVGQAAGGDARKGRRQSAAVVIADARAGRSRRPDGITANINVCEHPTPVAEVRRIYDTISQTLGYRTLEEFAGQDVIQLRIMLHALGYFRPDADSLELGRGATRFTAEVVEAVDAFRTDHQLSTASVGSPRGLVDEATVAQLWLALEAVGRAADVQRQVANLTAVRR
jgi:uncharacterized Ntn-hydrolase superfamily protein